MLGFCPGSREGRVVLKQPRSVSVIFLCLGKNVVQQTVLFPFARELLDRAPCIPGWSADGKDSRSSRVREGASPCAGLPPGTPLCCGAASVSPGRPGVGWAGPLGPCSCSPLVWELGLELGDIHLLQFQFPGILRDLERSWAHAVFGAKGWLPLIWGGRGV